MLGVGGPGPLYLPLLQPGTCLTLLPDHQPGAHPAAPLQAMCPGQLASSCALVPSKSGIQQELGECL